MKRDVKLVREYTKLFKQSSHNKVGRSYDDDYVTIPDNVYEELKNTLASDDISVEDNRRFMKLGSSKKYKSDYIVMQNYVGCIETKSGYYIEIIPKIPLTESKDISREKRVLLNMISCMKEFHGKHNTIAHLDIYRTNRIYDIFIRMYIEETKKLLKTGIESGYVEREENSEFYKGKLLINEHIKRNMVHNERFYVRYSEFNQDRPENRIIKSTLLLLKQKTRSAENLKQIKQLLEHFGNIKESNNYTADLAQIVISRNTKKYELLMNWSKVFLNKKSFAIHSGEEIAYEILFPMEKVYERYVALNVKKVFGNDGWSVSCQARGTYIFEEPENTIEIKPDIVIRKDNKCIIMDTKWKKVDLTDKNYGISSQDAQQMYTYACKYKNKDDVPPTVYLLYPKGTETKNADDIVLTDKKNGVRIKIFLVDLENIDESMRKLKESID